MCIRFAKWTCDRHTKNADFHHSSDVAHFDLGGYVNKQNCRLWGIENPYAHIEKPMQTKRVTVWYGFWSKVITRPFFFENDQGEAVTANGDRYRAMLNEFLLTKIEEDDIDNIWFQQDGATCHTAEATLDVLCPVFEDRIISRRAFWSPRSCDLTPLNYYLWSAVKDKCNADKPETIDALKDNIREAIDEIQVHAIDNALKNWTDRDSIINRKACTFKYKRKFEKIFSSFFLNHFPKKKKNI